MNVTFTIDKEELKNLIVRHLANKTGISIDPKYLSIQVKSKQNYKSEWEDADFKAIYDWKELE